MDAAVAALRSRAIPRLFTRQPKAGSAQQKEREGVCDCQKLTLPDDWKLLRRFPVLKRFVLQEWRRQDEELRRQRETPSKRRRVARVGRSSIGPAPTEDQSAQSMITLCCYLCQCGLLDPQDLELARSVVDLSFPIVLREVVVSPAVPLDTRMMLLAVAIRSQCVSHIKETVVDEWLQFVCDQLQQEMADRMVSLSRDAQSTPKRGRKSSHASDSLGSHTIQRAHCDFCVKNGREERRDPNAAPESSGYEALLAALQCSIQVLDGESNRRGPKSIANLLTALRNLLLTPEVRSWFRREDGNDNSMSHWMQLFEADIDPDSNAVARLSLNAYSETCEKVVSSRHTQDEVCLWTNVWRRELGRFARKKSIVFQDIIIHCSMADQFARCAIIENHGQDSSSSLGFQLVAEVIPRLNLSYVETFSSFAHVWVTLSKSGKTSTTGSISICRSYMHALLQHPNRFWNIVTSSTEVGGENVLQLMHLTWIIFGRHTRSAGEATLDVRMNDVWDLVLNQVHEYCGVLSGTTLGMKWLVALQLCASQVKETTIPYSPTFMISIKLYFEQVIRILVSSNGAFISSGGRVERKLVTVSDDLTKVQTLIALTMESLDHSRLCQLIANILQEQSVCSWRASSMEIDLAYRNGMVAYLFPGILAWIQREISSEFDIDGMKQTADNLLNNLLRGVHDQLRQTDPSSRYIPSLVCFCCGWDIFHGRQSKAANSRQPSSFAIDSGRRALLRLNVLSKIVKVYGNPSVMKQERRDVQEFIANLMEHADDVPTSLDSSMHQLQLELRKGIEHSDESDEPALISHSDEDLRDILEIFSLKDLSKIRCSVNQIKLSQDGHLDGLAQNVKRWVLLLESKDPRVELGKETKLELALYCNKLIYWFPEEFAEIQILQAPLDKQLVTILTEFVQDIRSKSEDMPQNSANDDSTISAWSGIRLELQLRSFLSSSVVPDLSALSTCVMDAMLGSETEESFQALQKWVRNNIKCVMIEIVIDKLRAVMHLVSSIDAAPPVKMEPDDERTSVGNARTVMNAMSLIASADTVFYPYTLEWNCSLFDETSAEKWLLHLYNAKFSPLHDDDTREYDLIACLEKIAGSSQCALKMAHSYWLAAMLCTVLFHSQSVFARITAAEERLRKILVQLLPMLSFASDIQSVEHGHGEGDAVTIWVVHLHPPGMRSELMCAQVLHDQLQVLSSSVLESNSTVEDRLRSIGQHALDPATNETAVLMRRLILTFSTWLPTAISHSQLHAGDSSSNSHVDVEWETCFVDQIVNLYLPLEFENCVSDLLTEWICIWISIDIVRAIKKTRRLVLLPFQRSLCLRLSNQYRHQSDRNQEPIWSCGFQCLHRLLEQCESSMGAIATTEMINVFMDTVTAFDLMSIATASISVQDKQVAAMALLQEFDQLISYDHTFSWSSSQLFSWLQYPLELVVYSHVCFDQDGDPQVLKAIMAHLRTKRLMHVDKFSYTDVYKTWEQTMVLKYAYLNDKRCHEAISAVNDEFGFSLARR